MDSPVGLLSSQGVLAGIVPSSSERDMARASKHQCLSIFKVPSWPLHPKDSVQPSDLPGTPHPNTEIGLNSHPLNGIDFGATFLFNTWAFGKH